MATANRSMTDPRPDTSIPGAQLEPMEPRPMVHPPVVTPSRTPLPARAASGFELRAHLCLTGFCGYAEAKLKDMDTWLAENSDATAPQTLDYMASAGQRGDFAFSATTLQRAGAWIYGADFDLSQLQAADEAQQEQTAELKRLRGQVATLEAQNRQLREQQAAGVAV